jgi:hypothetical protein
MLLVKEFEFADYEKVPQWEKEIYSGPT